MKKLFIGLISLLFMGCGDLDVNQVTSTDDGCTYNVYTYGNFRIETYACR